MLNSYDNTTILSFQCTAYNASNTYFANATAGNCSFNNLTGVYNFNISIPNFYESNKQISKNITGDTTLTNYSIQSLINVSAYQGIDYTNLVSYTASLPYSTNTTSGQTLLLVSNNASQNITGTKTNYFSNRTAVQPISGQVVQARLYFFSHNMTVNASDSQSGALINTYTLTLNSTTASYSLISNTSSGILGFNLINGNYSLYIDAPGYAYAYKNVTLTSASNYPNVTFVLDTTNSIRISIRDETTNALITNNVSVLFSSATNAWTNYTTSGLIYAGNLQAAEYSLTFSVVNATYSLRTYTLTVSNRSTQSLTAFLSQNISTVIFTVTDKDSSALLENVLSSMYRFINGSWQAVESKYTDITGKVQFNYLPSTQYKFFLSKNGYINNIFYLNPILYSSYDVQLSRSTSGNISSDYEGISVIWAPTAFMDDQNVTFNWIIQSPSGTLTGYGYNISYPAGSSVKSGSNAIGSQLTNNFIISGATSSSVVRLDYFYITSIAGRRNFTYIYPIVSSNNATMYANKDNHFGLGVFERVLIVTFFVLLFAGITNLSGKPTIGGMFGLIILVFFTAIGFIEWWLTAISLFVGFLLLGQKEGQ